MADDTRYVSYNDTSPTARRIAKIILNGFDAYFADFQNITLGAKARFETANWLAALNAHTRRLDLYKIKVNEITELLQGVTSKDLSNIHLWREARSAYVQLVASHANHEIAESFYNSIFNNFFDHEHIHQRNIFVLPTRSIDEKPVPDYSISISYEAGGDEATLFNKIMDDFEFSIPWEDKKRDVEHIVEVFRREVLTPLGEKPEDISVQMLESVFYRNKAAYIVGRAQCGGKTVPVILACRHTEKGSVYIDTLITDTDNASIIFSFTRSYFMVDASMPSQFVQFLQTLMPNKTLAELYNSLGMNKHGKTEFYRDLVRHMKSSDDLYVVAEGIKGMVMTVFTLPSYDQVFKIIKDKFDYPKTVTESIVKEKYRLVSRSDKA
ncbi:MAG: isocitrate dehydrogenase kinase/phosphatase AceK regulatory subunit, partial [bacterium]